MKFRTALILPLLLSACGQADDQERTSAATVNAAGPEVAQTAGLTPTFLEGPWCYTHAVMGDEQSDEMLNYIFSPDGTLLYQTNSSTAIDEPGTYVIDGDSIKIKPTLAFVNMQLESMTPDQMVFKMAYGQMYWSRGACKA